MATRKSIDFIVGTSFVDKKIKEGLGMEVLEIINKCF
jgi:hypothetical protein